MQKLSWKRCCCSDLSGLTARLELRADGGAASGRAIVQRTLSSLNESREARRAASQGLDVSNKGPVCLPVCLSACMSACSKINDDTCKRCSRWCGSETSSSPWSSGRLWRDGAHVAVRRRSCRSNTGSRDHTRLEYCSFHWLLVP